MTHEPALFLVDDDLTLSPLVKEYLDAKGMNCTLCHSAFEALDLFRKNQFDLCLLDIQMPMKSGFDLARDMVSFKPDIPFLFLTAQSDKEDRIKGFEFGAEDYVLKPFSMQELALRIKAILRRTSRTSPARLVHAPVPFLSFVFNPETRELIQNENVQRLSEIESQLLTMFLKAPDGIVLRDLALKQLWPDEHMFRDRSLNVFVSRLRHILKGDPGVEILNIHATGYRMIIR
ncbi:MAG TPA: response regulator transcription factor [Saprospiraceae bacterium]|nr:response regulator transcription factor [Saprospiraceae bacterium]